MASNSAKRRPFIARTTSILCALSAAATLATQAPAFAETPIPLPAECPSEHAKDWVYTMDPHEVALAAVDLESGATTFSLLADFEGTSIIIRVKDAETKQSLGVIKTDTSNTSTAGEIYAYRLARLLGFPEIVAPVIPVELNEGALKKLRDLMSSRRYSDANKEKNRQAVLADVNRAIANGTCFTGAFKVWVPAFMFHAGLGTRTSLSRQDITKHLGARQPQPENRDITLSQTTRLYSPQGTHRGTANLAQLTQDYSNMLLMDALMGQNDRYAGANVHFRAIDGERRENGTRAGVPIFEMGRVRLLALDNGASMKSRGGGGIADLQGNVDPATRAERFSRTAVEQLRALNKRITGEGCATPMSDAELRSLFGFLGVTDSRMRERAVGYIKPVLDYIDGLERRHGDAIFFSE